MKHAHRSTVLVFTLATLAASARAAQVWVVGPTPGPGIDFTTVQAAVASASSGDIVLVRAGVVGTYSGDVALGGKALTIVGDGALVPDIANYGRVTVSGLAAGATTVLRGFTLPGLGYLPPSSGATLALTSSPGTLLVEDCALAGSPGAVHALNSGWLGIAKSSLTATSFWFGDWSTVGYGLTNAATTTTLHAATSHGGTGLFISVMGNPVGISGGAGVYAQSGTVVAARSSLTGGDGGGSTYSPYFSACVYSGGGSGLWVAGTAVAHLLDTATTPGQAGSLFAPCTTPPTTPGAFSSGGTWTSPSGAAPVLDSSAVTREGQTLSVALESSAGELGVLLVATSVQPSFISEFYGPLLSPAATLLSLGVVPPAGSVGKSAQIQELGAGVEGVTVYLQGASVDAATLGVRLSNVSTAVLLDAAL